MLSSQQGEEAKKRNINPACAVPDFHGGSIVLENGVEIPITEGMIQRSFNEIMQEQEIKKAMAS